MPRRARLTLTNIPLHVIQRGNNRQACFFSEEDYRLYLAWLTKYSHEAGCQVHAYVLMTNHAHLLISADRIDSAGSLMKSLGQRYVQYINRTYRRSGTLWEGGYKSCPVQEEEYFLACQRYIELNPVRAGMVKRRATNGNFALGGEQFAAQISSTLGRRVVPGKAGRPINTSKPESGQIV